MVQFGVLYAVLSGVCNGLFSAPMKMITNWRWENIWLVFIITSCLAGPIVMVGGTCSLGAALTILNSAPLRPVIFAVLFGFLWGFGAIFFGLSVDRLGVSLSNSMVIGISSAMGSLVPLAFSGRMRLDLQQFVLILGVGTFLFGVFLCGKAGKYREKPEAPGSARKRRILQGYLLSTGAGIMSAVFNIGYSMAVPIADHGVEAGLSRFSATNLIWLLMLSAGSIPNIVFCTLLLRRNRSAPLFRSHPTARSWVLSVLMGILWGGSIFLYGAATPMLGELGPSIGWPLSLSIGLLTANLMGYLLGEWSGVEPLAARWMKAGVGLLLFAVLLCALSSKLGV